MWPRTSGDGGQVKTTLLQLVGFALIAFGAYLAWPPAGFIVAGVLIALTAHLAYLLDRSARQ